MKLLIVVLLAAASLSMFLPFLEARDCEMNKDCATKNLIVYHQLYTPSKSTTCDGRCAAWHCVVGDVRYRVYGCDGDDQHICANKIGSENYLDITTGEHDSSSELGKMLFEHQIDVDFKKLRVGECDPATIPTTKSCEKARACGTKDYKVEPQDANMVECKECVNRKCLKDGVIYAERGCENEKYVCNVGDTFLPSRDLTKLGGGVCDPSGLIKTTTSGTNDSKYGAIKLLGMILLGFMVSFAHLW